MLRLLLSLLLVITEGVLLGQTADEFRRQAEHLSNSFQWRDALQLLERGLRQHPEDAELLLQLGSLLLRTGHPQRARETLLQAESLLPGDPRVLRELGEAELRLDRVPEALRRFHRSLENPRQRGEAFYRIAVAERFRGRDDEALEAAARAVETNPLEPSFRRLYAGLLSERNQHLEAYEQLRAAQRLAPRDPHLLFQLAEMRAREGRHSQAVEYLESAVELDPEHPLYRRQLAKTYERLGHAGRSREQDRRAASLEEAFRRYVAAVDRARRGLDLEAIRILEETLEGNPEFHTGTLFLAELYQRNGEHRKALELYGRVLEHRPLRAAIEGGAWAQVQEGGFERALQLLGSLEERSPNQDLVEGYRSILEEDWKASLEALHRAETELPLQPELLQLISHCYQKLGRMEQALEYLQKADRIRPGDPRISGQIRQVKTARARQLMEGRHWEAAGEAFSRLIAEEGVEAEFLLNRAYSRQQLGQWQAAVEDYRVGLAGTPDALWARINRATLLHRLSRFEEAAAEWRTVLEESPTAEGYFELGLCYLYLERLEEAEKAFQRALRQGRPTPQLLYHLGIIRLRRDSPEEAMHLLRRSAEAGYEPARRMIVHARTRR